MLDGDPHELVIGGMVVHLVQSPTVAIVTAQLGGEAVGQLGQLQRIPAPHQVAEMIEVPGRPVTTFPRDRRPQGRIRLPEVDIGHLAGLIGHPVGGESSPGNIFDHNPSPLLVSPPWITTPALGACHYPDVYISSDIHQP